VKRAEAPWDGAQVDNLNDFQWMNIEFPPYTCDRCNGEDEDRALVATTDGWVCPGCNYTQNWASEYAANGSWRHSGVFW
jgi:hypothetical protein